MRNKNANKTVIDYDVNIYVREEYNVNTRESFWNTDQWYLQVYNYNDGSPFEAGTPFLLTKEEAFCMNFLETEDIDSGLDGWLSMSYLLKNYWEQMSDRIKEYLEGFPKYAEDVRYRTIYA